MEKFSIFVAPAAALAIPHPRGQLALFRRSTGKRRTAKECVIAVTDDS